jgi:hypothetical protein
MPLGYKEEILILLARAAYEFDRPDEQALLLNEAGVLIWRFDDSIRPRRADEIKDMLDVEIKTWLPEKICTLYTGPLLIDGSPTQLAETILVDVAGDSLMKRDKLLCRSMDCGLESNRSNNVQNLLRILSFNCLIDPKQTEIERVQSAFYTEILRNKRNNFIYSCPTCGYPMDNVGLFLSCSSPFCLNINYPVVSSNDSGSRRLMHRPISKVGYSNQLKLTNLAWRTIRVPLLFEQIIIDHFAKTLSEHKAETIQINEKRPGLSIREGSRKIYFEPVATYSAATVFNYYCELDTNDDVWIIVPFKARRFFFNLRNKLPRNFKIVTTQTYSSLYFKYYPESRKKL